MFGRFPLLVAFYTCLTFVAAISAMTAYGEDYYMLLYFGQAVVGTLICLTGLCVLDALTRYREEAAADAKRLHRLLEARLSGAAAPDAAAGNAAPGRPEPPHASPWHTDGGRTDE